MNMPQFFTHSYKLDNDSPDFNFGKILKISRTLKMLSTDQCMEWLMNCYLPTVNSDEHVQVTLKRIIFEFLCLHHSKKENAITNDQLNLLINFQPTKKEQEAEKSLTEKICSSPNATQSVMTTVISNVKKNNSNNLFYQIPESVISHNICPFLSLREIVNSFAKVCTLFAICCENGNVVETLFINGRSGDLSPLLVYASRSPKRDHTVSRHLYKCWKMRKLVINSKSNEFRRPSFWIKYIGSFNNLKYLKIKRM